MGTLASSKMMLRRKLCVASRRIHPGIAEEADKDPVAMSRRRASPLCADNRPAAIISDPKIAVARTPNRSSA